ncbi:hypothetical protein CPB83DRAFT_899831 [Crepidotus variabilis]|uniref:DUF6532 domain-containing protein n=1 Tax=Crepidotus variabilis TaxID=179855 RepID=A0A9P6JID4_9AGAR|nr:hypothetical protein CPB83DRAFT_899831 [Crepidotus variabilis]
MPNISKSEQAQRALETRRENAERERQEGIHLVQETAGGRPAKHRALKNPVWNKRKAKPTSGAAKKVGSTGGKKRASVRKQEVLIDDGEEEARNNSDDETLEFTNEQPPKIKKVVLKAVTKERSAPDFEDSEVSASDDDAKELFYERDGSKGDKEEEEEDEDGEGFVREQDVYDACPMILDEDEDDVGAGVFEDSNHRTVRAISSQPRTEIDDFDMEVDANLGDGERDHTPAVKLEAVPARKRRRQVVDSSDSDQENIPPAPAPPKKKVKSRVSESRKEAFRAERPQVNENCTPQNAARSSNKVTNDQWPDDVQLVPAITRPNKKRQLTEQSSLIQAIIRHSIDSATEDVLLRESWPEDGERRAYGKRLALKACDNMDICTTYDAIKEMKKRLQEDKKFATGVCNLIVDRLSTVRGPAKDEASKCIIGYQIGLGEPCKKRVQALLENHSYHMIGRWGGEDQTEWIPDTKLSFRNPVLIQTIKRAWFAKSHSVGYRLIKQFSSSVAGHPEEKEIPITLLALSMTAIYCCLSEYANGHQKGLDFNATTFLPVYRSIMNILKIKKEERPLDFHKRLHELYKQVVELHMIAANLEEGEERAANLIDF